MAYKEIAFLGDSVANGFYDETGLGWVGRLIQKLNKAKSYSYYHNNYAVSGDRIHDVLHRLCADVVQRAPAIVVIAIGLNDIVRWEAADGVFDVNQGKRDRYWDHVFATSKANVETVIVCALNPVDESKMPESGAGGRKFFNLNADIVAYNQLLRQRYKKENVAFIEIAAGFDTSCLYDATHPNTKGHELMAENAARFFQEKGL